MQTTLQTTLQATPETPSAADTQTAAAAVAEGAASQPVLQGDEASRPVIKQPEQNSEAVQASVMPLPTVLNVPVSLPGGDVTVATATPVEVNARPQLQEEKQVEAVLASYIGGKIPESLRQGLELTVFSVKRDGATDLKLLFTGPEVGAKADALGLQVVNALQTLPALAPYFAGSHKPHAQASKETQGAIEVHIPQLGLAHYASLLTALGHGVQAPQTPSAIREEAAASEGVNLDTPATIAPSKIETLPIDKPGASNAMTPQAAAAPAEVVNDTAVSSSAGITPVVGKEVPASTIATPAVNDARIAQEPNGKVVGM